MVGAAAAVHEGRKYVISVDPNVLHVPDIGSGHANQMYQQHATAIASPVL